MAETVEPKNDLALALHAVNAVSRRIANALIDSNAVSGAGLANAFRFAATDMQFDVVDPVTRNLLQNFQQGLHAFADDIDPHLQR